MRRISRSLPITIPWELSEFSFCGELYDVVISVTLRFEPGDPGCYRTPNGDGWPPTWPTVDLEQVRIVRADPPVDHEEFERTVRAYVYEMHECDTKEWNKLVDTASQEIVERDDYDG